MNIMQIVRQLTAENFGMFLKLYFKTGGHSPHCGGKATMMTG